ncbi:MAG: hypothetical protein ACOYNF_05395 [Rhodoferax sp.]
MGTIKPLTVTSRGLLVIRLNQQGQRLLGPRGGVHIGGMDHGQWFVPFCSLEISRLEALLTAKLDKQFRRGIQGHPWFSSFTDELEDCDGTDPYV